MSPFSDLLTLFLSAFMWAPPAGSLERQVHRTFQVRPESVVTVSVSGGRISVTTTPGRTAKITLIERVNTDSEHEADAALANYDVTFTQTDTGVKVSAKRTHTTGWFARRPHVNINAELAVPADVRLDLGTSGGSIVVLGDRAAAVKAGTSGGSIRVDGRHTDLDLDTSGGSIRVGRVTGTLRADTSGGSITVGQIGDSARDVDLATSGGSIRIGIVPTAHLRIDASTSGGHVSADALPLVTTTRSRSHIIGTLNSGAGRLRASTSGGSVRLYAAEK